tara:strand:+ start:3713 stop:4174 length:462 start_codon:yes stop_codon:yes gene_type:complete
MKFFFISFLFFTLDTVSKYIVNLKLMVGDIVEITTFLNLVNYKNTGFIFGIFSEIPYMLYLILNIFLFIIVLYIILKLYFENSRLLIPLSLITGGGIGNLIERFFYHGVTDFIDIYYKSYHWPAFNFADLFISSGIIIFILLNVTENRNCSQA